MSINVILPQMGESIFEGTVTRWLKKPGEKVAREESLFEVSTDKVDTEIPSPADGILSRIEVQEGETVKVGTVVAILEDAAGAANATEAPADAACMSVSAEASDSEKAVPAEKPPAAEIAGPVSEPQPAAEPESPAPGEPDTKPAFEDAVVAAPRAEPDSAAIEAAPSGEPAVQIAPAQEIASAPEAAADEETVSASETSEVEHAGSGAAAPPEAGAAPVEMAEPAVEDAHPGLYVAEHALRAPVLRPGNIRTSPLVRRLAEENGVDLSQLRGSGLGGRITRADLFSHLDLHGWKSAAAAPPEPATPDLTGLTAEATSSPAAARVLTEPEPPAPSVAPESPDAPTPPAVPAGPSLSAPPEPAATTEPARPEHAAPAPSGPPETPAPAVAAPPPSEPALAPAPAKPAGPVAPPRRPERPESAAPTSPGMVQPPAPPAAAAPYGETEIVTMTPMRKAIAEHMVLSRRTSAHVQTVFEVDMSAVVAVREKHKEEFSAREGFPLTYTPFFVKALVDTVRDFPIMNSSVEGDTILYRKSINVGIAVALETGLIVPVIRDAQMKSFTGLATAVHDLAERARSKRLKPDEVQYGTISLTNHGIYGSLFGTPIISQPQVAILGVGTLEKRPVVIHDAIGIRTMVYLVLSFDHRVIDGALADQFMSSLKTRLQSWTDWME